MDSRSQANLADIIYNLCVNFLLYVVLILVFYMLVRFYLEEDYEFAVKSEYSIVPTNDIDDDEEEDEIEEEVIQKKETGGEIIEKEAGGEGRETSIIQEEIGIELTVNKGDHKNRSTLGSIPSRCNSMFGNVGYLDLWGDVSTGTKEQVINRVIFCAVGLNIIFSLWGLLQERILTQTYDGVFFEYSYGLVFINRLGGLILSSVCVYYFKVAWVKTPLWEFSFPSVANMLSSWCQYEALKYVSFPTQMLAKAFKMVPTMLMGKFMHNKKYETYEYATSAVVGFGLYLFLDSSEHIDLKQNVFGHPESVTGAWCGVVLLILFLFFDSFTSQWQTRMFELHKDMPFLQMMLITNAFSTVFAFITLIHQEELNASLSFVYAHPVIGIHLFLFCVFSTIGQLFIFYTVQNFGAVVFSIIMSIRILCSTLLSCFVYSHPITELGYVGILIVFGTIAYRIHRKTNVSNNNYIIYQSKPSLLLLYFQFIYLFCFFILFN